MLNRPRGPHSTDRWQRILTFDEQVMHEVLRDASATVPGILTVIVVMFVSGLGGFIRWAVVEDHPFKSEFFFESVILGSLIATGLFFVWAGWAR